MRDELEHVLAGILPARQAPFREHPLAGFVRHELRDAVATVIAPTADDMLVSGHPGQGDWADSPWVGILDPLVTTKPTGGYYACYLVRRDATAVCLSLQLGTEEYRERFGDVTTRSMLHEITRATRRLIPEHQGVLADTQIDLRPSQRSSRAAFYQDAHVFGRTYLRPLPPQPMMAEHLLEMIACYRRVTARGGVDALAVPPEGADPDNLVRLGDEDRRKLALHYRVERNRTLAGDAKRIHGSACMACGFEFEAAYGALASGYIEAHHLEPLASLPDDRAIPRDPRRDFAVLCANCHRAIHRCTPPLSLQQLREAISARRSPT